MMGMSEESVIDLENKPELEFFLEDLPPKAEKAMKKSKKETPAWTIEDSENLYGVQGWGDPLFFHQCGGPCDGFSPGRSRRVVGSVGLGRILAETKFGIADSDSFF